MKEFIDKVVVITGGSSGIGEAIQDHFMMQAQKLLFLGEI